ncbi:MAG: site-specific integrase [Lachnospiraceae bacterium]|nr:site-specific integrase [Lachnospiraceae bacterium]
MYREEIENFIAQLNKSNNTIISYRRDLMQMEDYLQTNPDRTVRDYAELIASEKSTASVSRIYSSMNVFFRNLVLSGAMEKNPMDGIVPPKVKKNPRRSFTDDEKLVLKSMPKGYSDKAVRDRAMIAIMLDTGMKVSAILNLTPEDVSKMELPMETRIIIDDYIYGSRESLLAGNTCDRLFANCEGKPMSRQGFWKVIKKYTKDGGI